MERPNGSIWAIEIKRSRAAKPGKGFYQALQDIQPSKAFVVHADADRFPLSPAIEAIGLHHLMEETSLRE